MHLLQFKITFSLSSIETPTLLSLLLQYLVVVVIVVLTAAVVLLLLFFFYFIIYCIYKTSKPRPTDLDKPPAMWPNVAFPGTSGYAHMQASNYTHCSVISQGSQDSLLVECAGLMIERLQVQVPAGERGKFSSPVLTFCADSHSVSVPPHVTAVSRKRSWPFCQMCREQVTCIHPWPSKLRMGWLCCPRIVWEPSKEIRSHATHQGTLRHSCLSLLSHCGLILAKVESVCTSWSPL